jgi:hypothetical protein
MVALCYAASLYCVASLCLCPQLAPLYFYLAVRQTTSPVGGPVRCRITGSKIFASNYYTFKTPPFRRSRRYFTADSTLLYRTVI